MSLPDAPNTLREKYYSVMAGQNSADILPDIETAPSTENMYLDYIAKHGGGGSGSSGVTYSLSEVKTDDVWIDGKPIYRRTIQFTRWNDQFDAASMNIDNFFVDYSHSTFAAHTSKTAYTAPFVDNGAVQFDVWYDINNKMINMRTNGLLNNTLDAAYYTILYTKTTDTGNG